MIFNPFQREDQTNNKSKSKAFAQTLLPMSCKQLNCLLSRREDFSSLGKVVLLGRVVKLREMVGRTQVVLSDESGLVSLIEGEGGSELEEEGYFRFVVGVRMDKEEPVLYSQRRDKVADFSQIQYHMAGVMTMAQKMPILQV